MSKFSVCEKRTNTERKKRSEVAASHWGFQWAIVILEEPIAYNSDSGKQVVGLRQLEGSSVKGTTKII